MPINLTSLSTHKKQFQTPDMKVPVIFHGSENTELPGNILEQYCQAAQNSNLFHHIAVLSDVHEKKGSRVPAGTITASENYLFPQLLDAAPNCGMRMILTDLSAKDISHEKIDELFRALHISIPTSKYLGTKLPQSVIIESFRRGTRAIAEYFPVRIKNEIENTFQKGDMFGCENSQNSCTKRDIRDVIPSFFLRMAGFRLGILGATGSHFLYLLKVKDILDPSQAEKFGIFPGRFVFFMHTGSGIIGRYISSLYAPVKKSGLLNKTALGLGQTFFDSQMKKVFDNLRKKIKLAEKEKQLLSYDSESIEGRMFIAAHQAAGNFGFANRTVISHNLDLTLEKVFGEPIELKLLYDMPHVFINRENHFGKVVWVHRNGATRSLPDEPVFVAPLENTLAYLGVGTSENNSTFFSANHEMGKAEELNLALPGGPSSDSGKYSFNIYHRKNETRETQNEIYQNYAEKVIKEMEDNKIMKVVATFEPIAKLTY